jgi:uncharacterized membrane protein HdeD (DUF308 family)
VGGVLLLGVACVALGGVLTADLSFSLSALEWLVAAALVLTGLGELASAETSVRPWLSRAVAVVWIVAAIVAVAVSGITLRGLAIVVGVGLIVGGAVKVSSALASQGDERFVSGLSGVTNVVVGVLALSWPGVTVLVLAVLFGVRTVLFGFGEIALALRLRGAPPGEPVIERAWVAAADRDGLCVAGGARRGGDQRRNRSRGAQCARRVLYGPVAAACGSAGHDYPQRGAQRVSCRGDRLPGALQVDRLQRQADGRHRVHRVP